MRVKYLDECHVLPPHREKWYNWCYCVITLLEILLVVLITTLSECYVLWQMFLFIVNDLCFCTDNFWFNNKQDTENMTKNPILSDTEVTQYEAKQNIKHKKDSFSSLSSLVKNKWNECKMCTNVYFFEMSTSPCVEWLLWWGCCQHSAHNSGFTSLSFVMFYSQLVIKTHILHCSRDFRELLPFQVVSEQWSCKFLCSQTSSKVQSF